MTRSGSPSSPLNTAQSHLEAARFCFDEGRLGLALSEAYYTMYHVIGHAAQQNGDDVPRTHRGRGEYLYHVLIKEGPLTTADHKLPFDQALTSRERWHYHGEGPKADVETERVIDTAEKMIEVLS